MGLVGWISIRQLSMPASSVSWRLQPTADETLWIVVRTEMLIAGVATKMMVAACLALAVWRLPLRAGTLLLAFTLGTPAALYVFGLVTPLLMPRTLLLAWGLLSLPRRCLRIAATCAVVALCVIAIPARYRVVLEPLA